jgi:hypothetical protein
MKPSLAQVLLVLAMLTILLFGGSARAGDPYALEGSYEGLDHSGEQIRSLRIPAYLTLRSWRDRPWGLRLRLAATFATSDLFDFIEEGFENVRVSSFVPGIEFVIPAGQNHLLRPHLDAGVGSQSAADKVAFLGAIGLRTEFKFASQHFFAGLEPGFQVSHRSGVDLESSAVFSPFITVSGRRVLGFTIAGHQPDAGLFLATGYDFNALELASVRSTRDAVDTRWEVGAGFGFSQSRPKIGPFPVPRIRIGYRFGDIEGWRLRIGGDWLNPIRELPQPEATP